MIINQSYQSLCGWRLVGRCWSAYALQYLRLWRIVEMTGRQSITPSDECCRRWIQSVWPHVMTEHRCLALTAVTSLTPCRITCRQARDSMIGTCRLVTAISLYTRSPVTIYYFC